MGVQRTRSNHVESEPLKCWIGSALARDRVTHRPCESKQKDSLEVTGVGSCRSFVHARRAAKKLQQGQVLQAANRKCQLKKRGKSHRLGVTIPLAKHFVLGDSIRLTFLCGEQELCTSTDLLLPHLLLLEAR
jgi:hypothetical protein